MVNTSDILTNLDTVRAQVTAFGDQAVGLGTQNAQLQAQISKLQTDLDAANALIKQLQGNVVTTTEWGINASAKAQHDDHAKLFGAVQVWRYYHQPGEGIAYPTEYQLGTGESFILSGKVLPQAMNVPGRRSVTAALDAGHNVLLPHQISTSMMVDLFKSCPTDRKTRFCVWHEPENDISDGHFTVAQLRDAWHRARLAQQQVGPHIVLTPILMGYTWQTSSKRNPDDYIPAAADYDELLVDTYFAGSIGTSVTTIPTQFDGVIARAAKDGKRWGVAETGIGNKLTGQARLDALATLSKTLVAKKATVACYFMANGNEWDIDAAGVKAWYTARA